MGISCLMVLMAIAALAIWGVNKMLLHDASRIKLIFVSIFLIITGNSILLIFQSFDNTLAVIANIIACIIIFAGFINGITVMKKL